MKTLTKKGSRTRRHARIRSKIAGTSLRPRLAVFKSNTKIYAEIIDDGKGHTLAAASGKDAKKVGLEVAEKGKGKKVTSVVFDRGGYIYTGKVKLLADGAREGGLKF